MKTTPFKSFTYLLFICGFLLAPPLVFAAPVPVDTSALDHRPRSDTRYGIGFTKSVAQRPFVGVDDQSTSLPYIVFGYKDFYIEGLNIGYSLWQGGDVVVDALATPRFYEVKASFASNDELDGIEETKPTYLAGLSVKYRGSLATTTLQLLGDVLESDGYELLASVSRAFEFDNGLSLVPSTGITWQSAALVDHFYGVQSNEASLNRPVYGGHSSANAHVSATALYDVGKHIQLLAQVKYEALGSGTRNSPVVDEDSIVTAVIGAVYHF